WDFYTDLSHLEKISPPAIHLRVLRSSCDAKLTEGSDLWLEARQLIRVKWHTRISYLRPFKYEDQMISGPFKIWNHLHTFVSINPQLTEVRDEVEFELRYGPLGRFFESYAH